MALLHVTFSLEIYTHLSTVFTLHTCILIYVHTHILEVCIE